MTTPLATPRWRRRASRERPSRPASRLAEQQRLSPACASARGPIDTAVGEFSCAHISVAGFPFLRIKRSGAVQIGWYKINTLKWRDEQFSCKVAISKSQNALLLLYTLITVLNKAVYTALCILSNYGALFESVGKSPCWFCPRTRHSYTALYLHKMLYTIHGFIYPPTPPPLQHDCYGVVTSVNTRHHPAGVVTSVITLPSLVRALMALSKLSADDEHGIILGQRAAPRRVLQLFRLFRS